MTKAGLENRRRNKDKPKRSQIQRKCSDALTKNLSTPIPEFSPNAAAGLHTGIS